MHNGAARLRGGRRGLPQVPRRRRPGRAALQRAPALHRRVAHMASLGVDPAAYDGGVTSGDATRGMIEAWAGPAAAAHRARARPGPVRGPRRADRARRGGRGRVVCSGLYRRHQGDAGRLRRAVRAPAAAARADDLRQSGSGGGARRHSSSIAPARSPRPMRPRAARSPMPASRTCRSTSAPSPRSPGQGPARAEGAHARHRRRRRDRPRRRACGRPALGLHRQRRARAGRLERRRPWPTFSPRAPSPPSPRCRRSSGRAPRSSFPRSVSGSGGSHHDCSGWNLPLDSRSALCFVPEAPSTRRGNDTVALPAHEKLSTLPSLCQVFRANSGA